MRMFELPGACRKFLRTMEGTALQSKGGVGALVNNASSQASLLQGPLDEGQVFQGGQSQLTQGQLGETNRNCGTHHQMLHT